MKTLSTSEEVARRLKVTVRTISNWAKDGTIPCVRIGKTTVRFDMEAVEAAVMKPKPPTP